MFIVLARPVIVCFRARLNSNVSRHMVPDPVGSLMYLARFVLNPLLFVAAGAVLAFARPRWHGPWWLLAGAVVSLAAVFARLVGWPTQSASAGVWLAYEAAESLAFVAVGVGVFLIALRTRRREG